jgi:hypothetical protein
MAAIVLGLLVRSHGVVPGFGSEISWTVASIAHGAECMVVVARGHHLTTRTTWVALAVWAHMTSTSTMALMIDLPLATIVSLLTMVAALRGVLRVVVGGIHEAGWRCGGVGRTGTLGMLLNLRSLRDAMASPCDRSRTMANLRSVVARRSGVGWLYVFVVVLPVVV